MNTFARAILPWIAAGLYASTATAQEAAIRRNLGDRLPDLKIDEVTKTPIAGLYEVRVGEDILYADEQGNYLIQGSIVDTRTRSDLTQARINKLTAFEFAALPLTDAIMVKQGSGARKIVVFADPNCGYCRRFEADLLKVRDVTIYTLLYPILGGDSPEKSRNIWCAKEPARAWRNWMLDGKLPPSAMGQCDVSGLERIAALGRKHRVTGTPTLVLQSGERITGALPVEELEKRLVAATPAPTRRP